MTQTRTEKDSMGEFQVPVDAYYGAQTSRAVENFPISGLRFPRPFIEALGAIKYAAAEVNLAGGYLDERRANATHGDGAVASGRRRRRGSGDPDRVFRRVRF